MPFSSPLLMPSSTTRMKIPHATAKPVMAVRNLLRLSDSHISDNKSYTIYVGYVV